MLCCNPDICKPVLQVRFVVMDNLFPSDLRIHRKYDLKGSTQVSTRATSPPCCEYPTHDFAVSRTRDYKALCVQAGC